MRATNTSGFTLIELVIGIIVFSIALVMFTSLIVPQAIKSVDPIFQVRASELGQSLINEIAGKSFDEESDRIGGSILCSAIIAPICTASTNLTAEEGTGNRQNFDDVDDYNGFTMPTVDGKFTNTIGDELALDGTSLYAGFTVSVTVAYDADMDGIPDTAIGNTKSITVTVTTPNDEQINFSTFRSNY
jgi:MSHA pilin protein MshD